MAVLIDTDVLILAERNRTAVMEIVDEDCAISVITVSELLHGVYRADAAHRPRRRAFVEHVIASLANVGISTPVARIHAEMHAELSAAGVTIAAHDLWIGATAVAHDLGVATRNVRDFTRMPGLRVIEVA